MGMAVEIVEGAQRKLLRFSYALAYLCGVARGLRRG